MMKTPRQILKSLGLHPKKSLGQNFILEKTPIIKIITSAELKPSDHVLEIGAGLGMLTQLIAATGAHLIATEKDTHLFKYLQEKFSKMHHIRIVNEDFLDYEFPEREHIIIGNIPYNITVPILKKIIANKKYITITGGGPGIMSAVAFGTSSQKGICLGMRAELLTQEHTNDEFYSSIVYFNFLAARKYVMASGSDFLIFYPGGLGTLDEFFEYLVQVQLAMLENKKIICIGGQYWSGLITWLDKEVKTSNYLVNKDKDLKNISIVENFEEALSIIDESK